MWLVLLILACLYYAACLAIPVTIVVLGFKVGARRERGASKLKFGLGALLFPPVILAAAYYAASSTGCSGGDCTGPMILLGLSMIPAAAVSLFGLGILLQAGLSSAPLAKR
jgi:hypothetical protein